MLVWKEELHGTGASKGNRQRGEKEWEVVYIIHFSDALESLVEMGKKSRFGSVCSASEGD